MQPDIANDLLYPEPQFARRGFLSLNGMWEVSLSGGAYRPVRVPYCIESALSGIGETGFVYTLAYRRTFTLPASWRGGRVFLHFGAVDHEARVFVNGAEAGAHAGGYTPFSFEVGPLLREGENLLEVAVRDDVHDNVPSGKQSPKEQSFGCFYTRTTGIWQSVWLEHTPEEYLLSVRYITDAEKGAVRLEVRAQTEKEADFSAEIEYEGRTVGQCAGKVAYAAAFTVPLAEKHLWECGAGRLYRVRLRLGEDEVFSYFGLRDVRYEGKKFLLNGKSVFQRLVLEQGYYPDGVYTPASDENFLADIRAAIELGFNGARLHQKVFDPHYLYLCDRLGFLVWGEYPNWGASYYDLAALPVFLQEWKEAMERDVNRPSVITWCPLNETWADLADTRKERDVRFVDAVYAFTKALDPSRPCVDVSGGMHGHKTDVADYHCYDKYEALEEKMCAAARGEMRFGNMYCAGDGICYAGEPQNMSEFGGIAYGGIRAEPSEYIREQTAWGYETLADEESFVQNYECTAKLLLGCAQLSGFCYTQLYDVEQEQNGLLTYARRQKFSPEGVRRIAEANRAAAAIEEE